MVIAAPRQRSSRTRNHLALDCEQTFGQYEVLRTGVLADYSGNISNTHRSRTGAQMVAIAVPTYRRRQHRQVAAGMRLRRAPLPPSTYHRRRATVIGVIVAVAIVAITMLGRLGGGPLAASEPKSIATIPVASTTYLVQPGDTIWGIARRIQPSGDVRWLVDELVAQRGGRPLQAGERISLP